MDDLGKESLYEVERIGDIKVIRFKTKTTRIIWITSSFCFVLN